MAFSICKYALACTRHEYTKTSVCTIPVAPTAMGIANRKSVVSAMAKLGGGGAVIQDILHRTESGRRCMMALGMLPGYTPDTPLGTREVNVLGSIYAYDNGLLEKLKNVGGDVPENEIIAFIHHPDTTWKAAEVHRSPYTGLILCKRALGRVERGDAIFQVAKDVIV